MSMNNRGVPDDTGEDDHLAASDPQQQAEPSSDWIRRQLAAAAPPVQGNPTERGAQTAARHGLRATDMSRSTSNRSNDAAPPTLEEMYQLLLLDQQRSGSADSTSLMSHRDPIDGAARVPQRDAHSVSLSRELAGTITTTSVQSRQTMNPRTAVDSSSTIQGMMPASQGGGLDQYQRPSLLQQHLLNIRGRAELPSASAAAAPQAAARLPRSELPPPSATSATVPHAQISFQQNAETRPLPRSSQSILDPQLDHSTLRRQLLPANLDFDQQGIGRGDGLEQLLSRVRARDMYQQPLEQQQQRRQLLPANLNLDFDQQDIGREDGLEQLLSRVRGREMYQQLQERQHQHQQRRLLEYDLLLQQERINQQQQRLHMSSEACYARALLGNPDHNQGRLFPTERAAASMSNVGSQDLTSMTNRMLLEQAVMRPMTTHASRAPLASDTSQSLITVSRPTYQAHESVNDDDDDRKPAAVATSPRGTATAPLQEGNSSLVEQAREKKRKTHHATSGGGNDDETDEEFEAFLKTLPDLSRTRRSYDHEAFPMKLHRMLLEVEQRGLGQIISFTQSGRAFKVYSPAIFEKKIGPEYFRHQQFASFRRQLSTYGFRRLRTGGHDEGAFSHMLFRRNRPDLLPMIHRVNELGEEEQRVLFPEQSRSKGPSKKRKGE